MSLLSLFESHIRAMARPFSRTANAPAAPHRTGNQSRLLAAIVSAVVIAAAATGHAGAQTLADPPQKPFDVLPNSSVMLSTEKQSTVNPFPFGGGNAQNRGYGANDVYWGQLDYDIPSVEYFGLSRADKNGVIDVDGWQFPRLTSYDNAFNPVFPITNPNYNLNILFTEPVSAFCTNDGQLPNVENPPLGSGVATWSFVNGPSTNINSESGGVPTYAEAVAFPRPAQSATAYDAANKFVWRLDNPLNTAAFNGGNGFAAEIPGQAGIQTRYRIFVHIPTPSTTLTTSGVTEARIDDARYTVYYYVGVNGVYYARQQVCTVSQTSGGDFELTNADGSTAFFPMFSSATFTGTGVASIALPAQPSPTNTNAPTGTPGSPAILQGVAIDNTTGDTSTNTLFVVADSLTLQPSYNTVSATPTVTPPHGGRRLATSGTVKSPITLEPTEYVPGSADANYNAAKLAPHISDPNNVYGDTSGTYSYINDVNDPAYAGAAYANYVPWNVSTVFQGPLSLADPRFTGIDANARTFTGAQIGPIDPYVSDRPSINDNVNAAGTTYAYDTVRPANSSDATNNLTFPGPYFSHQQVLIAKTYYVQDPENSVSAANKTGTQTIAVGVIYALDWQTGAPVWRFPDRTYLPLNATFNGNPIPGAGLRNPNIGVDPITQLPVPTVPGIVAIDVNGDGVIEDDEVFLGASQTITYNGVNTVLTTGTNTSGSVNASVTIAPRVMVQGIVQVPVHNLAWTPTTEGGLPSDITSATPATPGRYYIPGTGNYQAVPIGMAFIAAGNGVIYGVDAYGNNDTRYYPGTVIPTGGEYSGNYFGTYQAGTTNVLWTFSATSHSQQPTENTLTYNQRKQGEVPPTSSFGASAPVLAWNLTDSEMAQNPPPATPELRLFVGNTNGVVYAMDPSATAGIVTTQDPVTHAITNTGVNTLPIVKGGQSDPSYYGLTAFSTEGSDPVSGHQADLRWWFQADGGINFAPAVSLYRHNMSAFESVPAGATPPIEKGVYITTQNGRVFCLDWDGPTDVTVAYPNFLSNLDVPNESGEFTAYDGSSGAAKLLNNDIYFHNTYPAYNNGIADTEQGHVRPRWTYPNLYLTNTAADADNLATATPDTAINVGPNGGEIGGVQLGAASTLGAMQNAPMLLDFWWQDPDKAGAQPTMLDYLAVVANDPTTAGEPATASRVYLLDQIGDRVNFLTNPRASSISSTGAATSNARVISDPKDRFTPHTLMGNASDATQPIGMAWTFRPTNEAYPATGTTPNQQDATAVQLRNMPLFDVISTTGNWNPNINSFDPSALLQIPGANIGVPSGSPTLNEYVHQPSRRMLPTLFIGSIGLTYAIDIDPETGLFMRWRPTLAGQEYFTPLSNRVLEGLDPFPGLPTTTGTMAVEDQIFPADHIFDNNATNPSPSVYGYTRSALATQEVLAWQEQLDNDQSAETAITVSAGPPQNRNNIIPENGTAQAMPSVPATPTNDLPNLLPFAIASVAPPSVYTGITTVTNGAGNQIGLTAATSTVDFNGFFAAPLIGNGLNLAGNKTGAVNQEINDPLATTGGRINSDSTTTIASAPGAPSPPPYVPNAAFPAPILLISTVSSYIHGVSTNVEGEDRESPAPSVANNPANITDAGDSHVMGWALAPPGNTLYFNDYLVNLFEIQGPGGFAGVADIANVYFPATDPYATAYRNAASGTSLNITPNLIPDEPNTTAPTPSGPNGTGGTVTDPWDPLHPRPNFYPRPTVLAQTAVANQGPTTLTDTDTGQSGFPLDLQGLYFDREFAGAGGATQFPLVSAVTGYGYSTTPGVTFNADGQYPLGDYHVWPRVPGYSNIGARLGNPVPTGLGYTYGDANDQVDDGVRFYISGSTAVDYFLPALPGTAKLQTLDMISDDINPVAQDVAWFYCGSDSGTVFAYTPSVYSHESGLQGGVFLFGQHSAAAGQYGNNTNGAAGLYTSTIPTIKVGIYTQAQLNTILASLVPTGGNGNAPISPLHFTWANSTIAAQGGKNYYEWGETVYILVYDLLAQPFVPTLSRNQPFVPNLPIVGGITVAGQDRSVTLNITSRSGTTVSQTAISLEGTNYTGNGSGQVLSYYQNQSTGQYLIYDANTSRGDAAPTGTIPLGVAVYQYTLGSNPGQGNSQTPGDLITVTASQTTIPQFSQPATASALEPGMLAAGPSAAYFAIANPLAVQGFLTAFVNNQMVPVNLPPVANGYGYQNAIGPIGALPTNSSQTAQPKIDVATGTGNDPNITGAEYWQALTNGNTLQRIDDAFFLVGGTAPNTYLTPNPHFGQPFQAGSGGQGVEPQFYFPVAASAGMINHHTSGTTTGPTNTEYLRIVNRSLLSSLGKVRVLPYDQPGDLLFRSWPGTVMNDDADSKLNPRLTPAGMDPYGRINPLPWEAIPAEPKPWSTSALVNQSQDYPDIQSRKNNAVQVTNASGDMTQTPGTLPASLSTNGSLSLNTTVSTLGQTPANTALQDLTTATTITLNIPQFQPANLVAAHELTSTYVAPNINDFPTNFSPPVIGVNGPLQLPRGGANRLLEAGGAQVVTPFGYTSHMVVFIDYNGTNKLNPTSAANRTTGTSPTNAGTSTINLPQKAYREFEVWTGVPVDQSLKIVESVIDLGALQHGFGMQNGLLGYNPGAGDATEIGLLPTQLSAGNFGEYQNFFKTFTVENLGNTNDYNLRASQKTEVNPGSTAGIAYNYFLLRSGTVDAKYGILASNADPNLKAVSVNGQTALNANVMPTIVTSLDQMFDPNWNAYILGAFESALGNAAGSQLFNLYYAPLAGRHTLHKPKVGSSTASVFGIPDYPSNQTIVSGSVQPPQPVSPVIGAAVPIGTPVGVYNSTFASSPFVVYEDHDTPNYANLAGTNYQSIPVISSSNSLTVSPVITPAGPLYHASNAAPPGTNTIYSSNNSGEGIWRAQSINPTTGLAVYLPYTYPYLTIEAKVTESGLTSMFPDLVGNPAAAPPIPSAVYTGVLPGVDPFPVVTVDNSTGNTIYRPASALTPASWRDSSGNIHIYFTRNNSLQTGGSSTPYGAQPGAPYVLQHSELTWNSSLGVWSAVSSGTPITAPAANTGHWLTSPVVLPTSGPIDPAGSLASDTSPFVLTHTTPSSSGGYITYPVDQATLFFTDSLPMAGGVPHNRIFYMDVTANGTGTNPQEFFVNADPSLARYAPRVAYDSPNGQDILMYYGGTPGKWSIYYVERAATNGLPSGAAPDASASSTVETPLGMPNAIVSASDPTPISRQMYINGALTDVVDVYFTGISRATQTPDIYQNRYQSNAGVLQRIPLPVVTNERLARTGRSGIWRAQNLDWLTTPAALPAIAWTSGGGNYAAPATNWKLDQSTGDLFQAVGNSPTTLTYVYVDASAGTIQFRGAAPPAITDIVTATYTPQTNRLTSDGASNFGGFTFLSQQILTDTTGTNTVIRRANGANGIPSGRNYLFWQKGSLAGRAPTLYFASRRVGIDLTDPANSATPAWANNESILLSQPAATTNNQIPMVTSVTVNGTAVPFDVDEANSRIYVDSVYEGNVVTVNFDGVIKGTQGVGGNGAAAIQTTTTGILKYLDELNVATAGTIGAALPISAGINEGQAAAFVDLYDWVALGGTRTDPPAVSNGNEDPAIAPGRVWVFWTSPRGRVGQQGTGTAANPDPYPSGFNLYWETIAPNYDGISISNSVSN